ncbi:hypothetical protein TWF694_005854 [Orbilia ellipsospora]|uniref:Uncharacterized protein n=1 Tax=Orbilia ellipsospora TaxID=2528407 RepID=A0AAV9WT91_9PEZI
MNTPQTSEPYPHKILSRSHLELGTQHMALVLHRPRRKMPSPPPSQPSQTPKQREPTPPKANFNPEPDSQEPVTSPKYDMVFQNNTVHSQGHMHMGNVQGPSSQVYYLAPGAEFPAQQNAYMHQTNSPAPSSRWHSPASSESRATTPVSVSPASSRSSFDVENTGSEGISSKGYDRFVDLDKGTKRCSSRVSHSSSNSRNDFDALKQLVHSGIYESRLLNFKNSPIKLNCDEVISSCKKDLHKLKRIHERNSHHPGKWLLRYHTLCATIHHTLGYAYFQQAANIGTHDPRTKEEQKASIKVSIKFYEKAERDSLLCGQSAGIESKMAFKRISIRVEKFRSEIIYIKLIKRQNAAKNAQILRGDIEAARESLATFRDDRFHKDDTKAMNELLETVDEQLDAIISSRDLFHKK